MKPIQDAIASGDITKQDIINEFSKELSEFLKND